MTRRMVQEGYESAEDKTLLVYPEPVHRNAFIEYSDVMVAVAPSESSEQEQWKATVIPKEYGTFENRVLFPAAWAGLKDEELQAVCGIPDAVFCHKNAFLFVAKSKEGAIAAAKQAK